uniref:Uncharacterized protein n=1 Tax=Cacopsylla melanoneura TaxID=428564 RepID=A0A8D8R7P3_9HEMI
MSCPPCIMLPQLDDDNNIIILHNSKFPEIMHLSQLDKLLLSPPGGERTEIKLLLSIKTILSGSTVEISTRRDSLYGNLLISIGSGIYAQTSLSGNTADS